MMRSLTAAAVLVAIAVPAFAQAPKPGNQTTAKPAAPATAPAPAAVGGGVPPADYVIGADDQLEIVFWREKDVSGPVTVRPDGMISLPLLNEVRAAGLTPEELRITVTTVAEKLLDQPTVSVIVKAINSRKVFLVGQIAKPGPYPLLAPPTVLQMIATAGGPSEYAKLGEIVIVRTDGGKTTHLLFNYEDILRGRKLEQNILLKPGDTIAIP